LVANFRRSVIIAELWRPEVARTGNFVSNFFVFFGKTTPYGKIFKIMFRKFSPPHRSTLSCLNVVKFVRREIDVIVRYLPDQKKQNFGCLSNCIATARMAPETWQASPHQYAHSAPDFIQIGLLRRSYSQMREHRFLPRRVFP